MAFSQATITDVFPPIIRSGQVFLSWTSSSPEGTWFQIYENGALAWFGQRRSTWMPVPSGPVRIDIGAVVSAMGEDGFGDDSFGTPAGKDGTDYSADLPPTPARRAKLEWPGGYFQGADLAGFKVFGETTAGGGVNYARALATITAYPANIATDGFGLGLFGSGGFGSVAGTYVWISEPLYSGDWTFAVRPFDHAGNLGASITEVVTIAAPPRAPGLQPDGITRLRYSMISGPKAVLTWLASPS